MVVLGCSSIIGIGQLAELMTFQCTYGFLGSFGLATWPEPGSKQHKESHCQTYTEVIKLMIVAHEQGGSWLDQRRPLVFPESLYDCERRLEDS